MRTPGFFPPGYQEKKMGITYAKNTEFGIKNILFEKFKRCRKIIRRKSSLMQIGLGNTSDRSGITEFSNMMEYDPRNTC